MYVLFIVLTFIVFIFVVAEVLICTKVLTISETKRRPVLMWVTPFLFLNVRN